MSDLCGVVHLSLSEKSGTGRMSGSWNGPNERSPWSSSRTNLRWCGASPCVRIRPDSPKRKLSQRVPDDCGVIITCRQPLPRESIDLSIEAYGHKKQHAFSGLRWLRGPATALICSLQLLAFPSSVVDAQFLSTLLFPGPIFDSRREALGALSAQVEGCPRKAEVVSSNLAESTNYIKDLACTASTP
jgi:hypothetical protein